MVAEYAGSVPEPVVVTGIFICTPAAGMVPWYSISGEAPGVPGPEAPQEAGPVGGV